YATTFQLPEEAAGRWIILESAMTDDVIEVVVNGTSAGVRLWAPYEVDITDHVQPGQNTLELRLANTLVNPLEAVPRASGLAGEPGIHAYEQVDLALERGPVAGGE